MVSIIRRNSGQSLVEFALVLPILLLVCFGITEFSRCWMTVNVLTSAAREGCRLAVVTAPDSTLVFARVTDVCTAAGVTPTAITMVPPNPFDPERRVSVTVQADFQILTGTFLGSFSGIIPLSSTAVMRHEAF